MRQDEVQLDVLQMNLRLRHSYYWYLGQHIGLTAGGPDHMPPNLDRADQDSWIGGYREGLKQREDQKNGNRAKMKHMIGVAAVLFDDKGSILLEHRAKDPGSGLFVLAGGKLDEPDPRDGVSREVKEELGLEIHPSRFTPVYSGFDTMGDGTPLIMLYFAARIERGTERNMEPNKCHGLRWFRPYLLPTEEMWTNDRSAISYADTIFDFRRMGMYR
jgi:8-oxo-dGTP pyrophosphatase MutT (NUDIX family)